MTSSDDPVTLFDTHTHLQDRAFDPDRGAALERARSAGVTRMVIVGEDRASSEAAVALAERTRGGWAAIGVHPHHARLATAELEDWLRIGCQSTRVVAIGEIGLDYHYDRSPRDVQRATFERQLALARSMKLLVVIHSREALADTLSILSGWHDAAGNEASDPVGVMHCFGYDWEAAKRFLALGFMISIPGTVTFPRAEAIREVARSTPANSLVLETDAPVLSPQRHRGRRNEPSYLAETAAFVASLRRISVEALAEQTTANALRLFRLPVQTAENAKVSGARA